MEFFPQYTPILNQFFKGMLINCSFNELTSVSADTNRLSNVKRRICVVYSWSIQSNMSNTRNFWRGTEKQFTVVLMPMPVNAFERKYIWSCGFEKKNLDEKIFTLQKSSYKISVFHKKIHKLCCKSKNSCLQLNCRTTKIATSND